VDLKKSTADQRNDPAPVQSSRSANTWLGLSEPMEDGIVPFSTHGGWQRLSEVLLDGTI
jgi:hypothetical protein